MLNEDRNFRKSAEARLFSYKDLHAKLLLDRQDFQIAQETLDMSYDTDNPRLMVRSSLRLERLRREIERGQRELERLDDAIGAAKGDYYAQIIELKYLKGLSDETIAEQLSCDVSTVRRNKKRILSRIAVRLYGVDALCL